MSSLLDLVKARKVLLLDTDNPNYCYFCSNPSLDEGERCPYLVPPTLSISKIKDPIPFCIRYQMGLRVSNTLGNGEFIYRCEKCENDKF